MNNVWVPPHCISWVDMANGHFGAEKTGVPTSSDLDGISQTPISRAGELVGRDISQEGTKEDIGDGLGQHGDDLKGSITRPLWSESKPSLPGSKHRVGTVCSMLRIPRIKLLKFSIPDVLEHFLPSRVRPVSQGTVVNVILHARLVVQVWHAVAQAVHVSHLNVWKEIVFMAVSVFPKTIEPNSCAEHGRMFPCLELRRRIENFLNPSEFWSFWLRGGVDLIVGTQVLRVYIQMMLQIHVCSAIPLVSLLSGDDVQDFDYASFPNSVVCFLWNSASFHICKLNRRDCSFRIGHNLNSKFVDFALQALPANWKVSDL
mmetsp:Transcript_2361/g.4887  ORF Transcript_2361/g.4887 Transcript_2361/m.4887 type:complete len:316 (+) Transcript_2361:733-1680(+)